jgi:2-polyprenyl-3-methyl-5-hydroxy-6-metoxy-1,4-benzoquinol methylase
MAYERIICILCNGDLRDFFCRKQYPITCSPPENNQPFIQDIFADQNFSVCNRCSCVQLKNLIHPSLLYSTAHNNTFNTPTWLEHHKMFCNFIFNKVQHTSITELGGSGKLFELMKRPDIEYTCLDISTPNTRVDGVYYIVGNCETHNYSGIETVVMSHVFEHLFNPQTFLETVSQKGVKHVYISIPNMKALVDSNNIHIIHNEHTFYIDKPSAIWLFNQYGYSLVDIFEYKTHSLFMYFSITETPFIKLPSLHNQEIEDSLYNIFLNEKSRLAHIIIKPNSFIVPGGLYGQFIAYYCKPVNILGFLDNDTTKQGHRVYGTPYFTYGFDELAKYSSVTLYLWNGQYTSELINQIKTYSVNYEIIIL